MSTSSFVLRDLPGVAEIEARLERIETHPSPAWAPENDGLQAHCDRISLALFGITEAHTRYTARPGLSEAANLAAETRWEQHFAFLYGKEDELVRFIFDAMGWDMSDGEGDWARAGDKFDRQIVCASKGLCGHLPGTLVDDATAIEAAATWGAKLAAEAAKYRPRRSS